MLIVSPNESGVFHDDRHLECRRCSTPTDRREVTVNDGDLESGPSSLLTPICAPCAAALDAEIAALEPPCFACGSTAPDCCPAARERDALLGS